MLKKILLISTVSLSCSLAASFNQDDYLQIVGDNLEEKDGIVKANGNLVVYSPNYYITANRLIYDKKNYTIELFNDVNIVKNNEVVSVSNYSYVDMKNELNSFKPFLMLDNTNKLWFNSTEASSTNDKYKLLDSTLSSCDCKDPAWSISFSQGDFNTTDQWVNTYNTTLYIKNLPILYTPYFGFTTDNTRRTGLLKPTIGWSSKEGLSYAQPIYYAPQSNYDFEYIPQVRNQRGYGHALKYRYADSLYSSLTFETGFFKEKDKYQKRMSLTNDKHYGWNLEYKRDKLFSNYQSTDGLIIELLDMNDVDYENTKYNNDSMDYTDKYLESKIKYFYNTNNLYADVEMKMYNDISKENNDDVMQNIPSINVHKYSNSFLLDNLTYSLDTSIQRKTRKVGLGADTTNIHIPLSYNFSLMDDYLNFNISEQIKYTNISYKNNTSRYENVHYGENNHLLELYTDLIKPYENYLHTIKLDTTFTYSNVFKKDGDIYGLTNNSGELSTFGISKTNKNLSLGLSQSIYNKSLKEIVNHKIKQSFIYNENTNGYDKNNLENDLTLYYEYGSLANRLSYNHKINEIIDSSTTLKFLYNKYFFNSYYIYNKDENSLKNTESLKYDFGFSFNKYYSISYKEEHDLTQDNVKKREYIFDIDEKCWGINFKLVDSLVASSTTNDSALRQKILYMEFNLKELFMLSQKYKFKEKNE